MCSVFCVRSACTSEADVVFIIDASGSLDEPNVNHIKNFVSNLSAELDVDSGRIRIGVVTYSDYAEPQFNLSQYNTRYRRCVVVPRFSDAAVARVKLDSMS